MKRTIIILSLLFLVKIHHVQASLPQVSGVSPSTVSPGDTLTLSGTGFVNQGQTDCYGTYDQASKSFPDRNPMTFQTVIGAYKAPNVTTNGHPNFRLSIVSLSENTIQAQIPQGVSNGEYLIGYNAEYPKGVCDGYGDQLVGFARYDKITIIGGTAEKTLKKVVSTVTQIPPTSTPIPEGTVMTTPADTNSATDSADTAQEPSPKPTQNIFVGLLKRIIEMFQFWK